MRSGIFLLALTLAWATACIVEAPGAPRGGGLPPERARGPTPTAAAVQVKIGANLEDKLEIQGAIIQPGTLLPGEAAHITALYKVLAPLNDDYMVFVHVEDADGRVERVNVDHPPSGGRPSSQWTVGEVIRDEYTVMANSPQIRALRVYTGFWLPRTDARLKLKNADQVPNDGNNRVVLAQIPVTQ